MIKDFLWWLLKDNLLINFIYLKVLPYYFKVPKRSNDQSNLPIINKNDAKQLYKKPATYFSLKGYTSGTTNSPFTVFRSIKSIILEEYIVKSYLFSAGVPLKARIAVLRGDKLKQNKIIEKMPFTGRAILSSYRISEDTAIEYLKALDLYKPDIVMAFPSSIILLSKYAKKLNWKPSWKLVGVLTSSETFNKENQELVTSVFGRVLDHYGQAERVAALQLCSEGHYHSRDDYSLVEFIPTEHGTTIVGSNYHNSAMPLSRYDTQDIVEGLNVAGLCPCGNKSNYVTKILGRDDDFIILPNGGQVGRLGVVFKDIKHLVECQLEQVKINKIIIRYVATSEASNPSLEEDIKMGLQERIGTNIEFTFECLTEVPRTKAGKFRTVIRNKDIQSV